MKFTVQCVICGYMIKGLDFRPEQVQCPNCLTVMYRKGGNENLKIWGRVGKG